MDNAEKKKFDQLEYIDNYNKDKYANFGVRIPKKMNAEFNEKLKKDGMSKAAFVKKSIEDYLKK